MLTSFLWSNSVNWKKEKAWTLTQFYFSLSVLHLKKTKEQFRHFWPQLPYLDTEEQGGSIVHWLGKAVGARLLTESQVHSGKGRKSWNDLTHRDSNSSENLAPHPATLCMRSLRKKQKQQTSLSAPTQTDRITQLCMLQPGFSVTCLKWQMFLMQIVRMWTIWKKKKVQLLYSGYCFYSFNVHTRNFEFISLSHTFSRKFYLNAVWNVCFMFHVLSVQF